MNPETVLFTLFGLNVTGETLWVTVGFLGQAMFGSRFLVQWLYSEKHKESLIPNAFWFLSIGGGVTLLSYAIWREDPVFIMGQAFGLLVYARNLRLIYGSKYRRQREENAEQS